MIIVGAQWLPSERGYPDSCLPSRYWVYMLNSRVPSFEDPPKNCASPEFSYSLTLRENRSGSPVRAFICWVCKKHAVSPQVLRLPRIFPFLNITRLPRNAVSPQFLLKKLESSGDRPIIVHDFDAQKISSQIQKIFTNFKNLLNHIKNSFKIVFYLK